MNYRNNNGDPDLSILGFGCMRFPKKGNSFDMVEVEKEIMYAIANEINYFDTAYVYSGSEEALGTVLAKNNCRDKVKIATKLPHYLVKKEDDLEKYFSEQLRRLKTDYVDYYLMHMLPDINVWNKLIGLVAAAQKGIPVVIMEPLRGGALVNHLPKKVEEVFAKAPQKRGAAEWALRWLWNQKEVSVVLSGMNSMAMVEENIKIASTVEIDELTQENMEMFEQVKDAFNEKTKVNCTACSYCMPCPFGVDIPGSFRCYNVSYTDGYWKGFMEYLMCTTLRSKRSAASLCKECGACEKHCPQSIPIRAELKKVKRRFENPIYKLASVFIKRIYQ